MCLQVVAVLVILAAAQTSANRGDEAADSMKEIVTQDSLTEKIAQEIEAEQEPTIDRAEEKARFQAKQSTRIAEHYAKYAAFKAQHDAKVVAFKTQHDAQVAAFKIAQLTKKGMEPEKANAVVKNTVLAQDKTEESARFQATQSATVAQHDAKVEVAQLTKKGLEPEKANAVVKETLVAQDREEERARFKAKQSARIASHDAKVVAFKTQHDAQVAAFKVAQLTKKGMEPEEAKAVVKKTVLAQDKTEEKARFEATQSAREAQHDAQFEVAQLTKKGLEPEQANVVVVETLRSQDKEDEKARFQAKQSAQVTQHDANVAAFKVRQLIKKGMEPEKARVAVKTTMQLINKGMEPEKASVAVKTTLLAQQPSRVATEGKKKMMMTTDDADAILKARVNEAERMNEQLFKRALESEEPTKERALEQRQERALELRQAEEEQRAAAGLATAALQGAASELRTAALKGLAVYGAVALAKDVGKRNLRAQMFRQNFLGR